MLSVIIHVDNKITNGAGQVTCWGLIFRVRGVFDSSTLSMSKSNRDARLSKQHQKNITVDGSVTMNKARIKRIAFLYFSPLLAGQ